MRDMSWRPPVMLVLLECFVSIPVLVYYQAELGSNPSLTLEHLRMPLIITVAQIPMMIIALRAVVATFALAGLLDPRMVQKHMQVSFVGLATWCIAAVFLLIVMMGELAMGPSVVGMTNAGLLFNSLASSRARARDRRGQTPVKAAHEFPSVSFRKDMCCYGSTCAICLEEFDEGHQVCQLPCHHIFHQRCLRHWLSNHDICPFRCSLESPRPGVRARDRAQNQQPFGPSLDNSDVSLMVEGEPVVWVMRSI